MRELRTDAPRIIEILTDIPAEWRGFRFAGKYLVTPEGDRLTPERVRGLAWRDHLELRRAGYASRKAAERVRRKEGQLVKVVIVQLGELRCFGRSAG